MALTMPQWELLDEKGEQELHKARLLNVEEKPFKRVSKRLATINSLVNGVIRSRPSQAIRNDLKQALQPITRTQLREDILLDFAAFDSNVMRLQFLHDANERERERYAADQQRIHAESQDVRANNGQLRERLGRARSTLEQRKKYDELADTITSNKMLRPRDEQIANLAKLEDECRELERESETYTLTWSERRDQFNRIMEEGMLLRRQIRDEKEEVDRREGMVEDADEDGDNETKAAAAAAAAAAAQALKNNDGNVSTPRPAGEEQSQNNGDGAGGDGEEEGDGRKGPHSGNGSTMVSRDATPAVQAAAGDEDVEMEGDEQADGSDRMETDT